MEIRSRRALLLALVVVVVVALVLVGFLAPAGGARKAGRRQGPGRRSSTTNKPPSRSGLPYPGFNGPSSPSYESTRFGYSKNFFKPITPTIRFLLSDYRYPSSIPRRSAWRCDCYVKGRTAVCADKLKDDRVPPCVGSSVTAVFIRSKQVSQLPAGAFGHVPQLKYINITDTKLRTLPRDLFRENRELKHLLIRKNPTLAVLDGDVFRGARKVENAVLDRNSIGSLARDVFVELASLRRLSLAYNRIRALPEGVFRANRQLRELRLSGNPLGPGPGVPSGLLRNNARLRTLLMSGCGLRQLPAGLLSNASSLEWLDVSTNSLSSFPAELIRDCPRLAHLDLHHNELEELSLDIVLQHGGYLATLELRGNPWRCECSLAPLAAWAALRRGASQWQAQCGSPAGLAGDRLPLWFLSVAGGRCGVAISSLRADLNRALSLARAISRRGPHSVASWLSDSDEGEEVGFAAAHYFLLAMTARTAADVGGMVWRWARLLEQVHHRQCLRDYWLPDLNSSSSDWIALLAERSCNLTSNFRLGPLPPTSSKPPPASAIKRLKGFEPAVNFTYVMENVPENLTKQVDEGIEEELQTMFGGPTATARRDELAALSPLLMPLNATGLVPTDMSASEAAAPPKKLSAADPTVAGLRSEVREMMSTLLRSVDRARWDTLHLN